MSSSADWPCTCGHAFEDHDDNKDTHCRESGCDCPAYRPQAHPMSGASDDGQAGVTESDRATARTVVQALSPESAYVDEFVYDGDVAPLLDAIAVALAAEREKAREPFLALAERTNAAADELESEGKELTANGWPASGQINLDASHEMRGWADRIRRAAEEQQ